jgi:hypothetical protein
MPRSVDGDVGPSRTARIALDGNNVERSDRGGLPRPG